jgi:transposase
MRQIEFLDGMISDHERRIEEVARPFENAIPLLDTIQAINRTAAMAIVAEIGVDMSQFPDHRHLGSWSGICPGNNESAGKHKGGATRKASKYLRATLVECAWAALRTKKTYFRAQFRRMASRRGATRALIAVAHSLLAASYYVSGTRGPTANSVPTSRLLRPRLRSYYVKRLTSLGYHVDVKEAQPTAQGYPRSSQSFI